MKVLISGIQYSARQKMLGELKGFESKLPPLDMPLEKREGKLVFMHKYRHWHMGIAAASLILVAVFTFLLISTQKRLNPDEAFMAYYQPCQNVVAPMKRGERGPNSLKEEAAYAYENGDYRLAVSLFEQLDENQVDVLVLICKGNAYIGIENYEKAQVAFDKIIQIGEMMVPQAKWYTSLVYLKQGKVALAKASLQDLHNGGGFYAVKAGELLGQLE